ncbi:hypothetical protein PGT21_011484 [Puccinia graminis f. sp. tritici]|uniref:Uncharacterized protein n=1 Tax=Puccinia graminis f. sp. tritici TaxID=56615 RepID=A0A5B0MLR9_PUCGR|nr:hypothetical protein PGT21_011484 [Puccinia graminis f. sp. tritici]
MAKSNATVYRSIESQRQRKHLARMLQMDAREFSAQSRKRSGMIGSTMASMGDHDFHCESITSWFTSLMTTCTKIVAIAFASLNHVPHGSFALDELCFQINIQISALIALALIHHALRSPSSQKHQRPC